MDVNHSSNNNMSSSSPSSPSIFDISVQDLDSIDVFQDVDDVIDVDEDGGILFGGDVTSMSMSTFDTEYSTIDEVLGEMDCFTTLKGGDHDGGDDGECDDQPVRVSDLVPVTDEEETMDSSTRSDTTASMNSSTRSTSSSSSSSSCSSYYYSTNGMVGSQVAARTRNIQGGSDGSLLEDTMMKLDQCMRRTAESRNLIEKTAVLYALKSGAAAGAGAGDDLHRRCEQQQKVTDVPVPVSIDSRTVSPQSPSGKRVKQVPIKATAASTKKATGKKEQKQRQRTKVRRSTTASSSSSTKKAGTPARKKKTQPPKTTDMLMPARMGINLKHIQSLLMDCPPSSSSSSSQVLMKKSPFPSRGTSTIISTPPVPTTQRSVSDFLRNHKRGGRW
mmetsp:Transcript_14277/g.34459  ORF Transcript_14277/g.34459 Transcript_14277/m.34459 type:complete len:388 (+) Transcript_14277:263-1426(+)